jgi:hypothetical protein
MVKIKSNNVAHFGQETITSSGKIKFDSKGFAEVDDNVARELIKKFDFISLADGSELPDKEGVTANDLSNIENLIRENHQLKDAFSQLTVEKDELLQDNETLRDEITKILSIETEEVKSEVKEEEKVFEKDSEENDDEFIEIINKTAKTDLQEDADKANYPKSEWKDLNVKDLRKYMIGKLKE